MFKNLSNMGAIFKQAQDMQKKMTDVQAGFENKSVTGEAGAGLVVVEMNLKGHIVSLKIDPSLIKPEEREILEDLIITATNDARRKADDQSASEMEKVTAGLNLPAGFKLPF